uniref:Uncharacterized protein n=1 Tax=Arundo donax TaxID=35708 RepID=A0A0A9ATG6_ARUDO
MKPTRFTKKRGKEIKESNYQDLDLKQMAEIELIQMDLLCKSR